MLERTIYFSGPSGTGKTHLIAKLLSRNPLYIGGNPEKLDRKRHVRDKASSEERYSETFQYAVGKIEERVTEARYHAELEQQHPSYIILGDRCFHDTVAYLHAATKYGDLTQNELEKLLEINRQAYNEDLIPKHIVLVNFSFDDLKSYLSKRWEREGKGFREDDDRYLRIVSESFEECFKTLGGVLWLIFPDQATPEMVENWIKERIVAK